MPLLGAWSLSGLGNHSEAIGKYRGFDHLRNIAGIAAKSRRCEAEKMINPRLQLLLTAVNFAYAQLPPSHLT